jgi:DNA-binding MarR family transcriptional regulator
VNLRKLDLGSSLEGEVARGGTPFSANTRYAAAMPEEPVLIAQELRVAVGRVARRLRRISAERDTATAVKFTEVTLLLRLAREGRQSPSDLARHEQVTSQAIAAIVRELQARKLVRRGAHSTDGRRSLLSITDAGRAALWSDDQAALHALVETLGEHYTKTELRRLAAAIPLLNRLADLI